MNKESKKYINKQTEQVRILREKGKKDNKHFPERRPHTFKNK